MKTMNLLKFMKMLETMATMKQKYNVKKQTVGNKSNTQNPVWKRLSRGKSRGVEQNDSVKTNNQLKMMNLWKPMNM